MSHIKEKIINVITTLVYPIKKWISPLPSVKSVYDTIELIKEGKSIARFGDGEFHILNQTENLGFQNRDEKLAYRLKEVLNSDNKYCLIGLPRSLVDVSNLKANAALFWKRFFVFHYSKIVTYLHFDKYYYDSNVTRPYMDYFNNSQSIKVFEEIKKVWNLKKVLIVEGQFSKLGVGNDLFDNVIELKRVLTLSENAFSLYNEVLEYIIGIKDKFDLVLIALGPTATVMAYDLSLVGIQAIDIGHIDIEYEWFLLGAEAKTPIIGKYVNEVFSDEDLLTLNNSTTYHSQIIKEIYGNV